MDDRPTPHLIELFDNQVDRFPDETALIVDGARISYRELRDRARTLAAQLVGAGVNPGDTVACRMAGRADTLAAALAALAAGAAYAAMDPAMPEYRIGQMLANLQPAVILADGESTTSGAATVVNPPAPGAEPATEWPDGWRQVDGDSTFHIVYTSGTTGTSRGVLIPHRAVINRLQWMWETYPFQSGDTAVWHKSAALVASPWEMFGALLQGVPTLAVEHETVLDPQALWRTLTEVGATHFLAAPALLAGLAEEAAADPARPCRLRFLSTSAESISPELVHTLHARFPRAVVVNMYGLSECASNVTVYDTAALAPSASKVPIGRPISGCSVLVVDGRLRPVPIGVEGEMLVSGACLATGYLGEDELTAKRFITVDPGDGQTVRMYRTGDRARLLPSGALEYAGRTDDQVQVRGFRVELGDVQAALELHPEVSKAVVRSVSGADGTELTAFLEGDSVDLADVRAFMQQTVPQFMLPSRYLVLQRIPLTASGKVDMAALDELESGPATADEEAHVAPRTATEEMIAGVWTKALRRESVGVHDVFFDIGGQSLMAARIMSQLRGSFGLALPIRLLFDHPTVAELAAIVDQRLHEELKSMQSGG
ncbi:non-ribosomal peptide synthetase [Streptomyces canus]|uniref:non-ribosomal peptide synthetase n=1 Tax=Streptomyces canus TaxID=58343 RepID=UPI0033BC8603